MVVKNPTSYVLDLVMSIKMDVNTALLRHRLNVSEADLASSDISEEERI